MQLLFWKGKHGAYLIPEELTVDSKAFIEWTQSVDANNPKELAIMKHENLLAYARAVSAIKKIGEAAIGRAIILQIGI